MGRIRAVIFDLDGTLTDSAPEIAQALNVVWADLGRPAVPLGTVAGYIGDGPGKLIERARAALGLAAETAAVHRETDAF
ncbi:MAG: phosphoglycolate phosphatase, partial [Alphaproteobacteria bacterium]